MTLSADDLAKIPGWFWVLVVSAIPAGGTFVLFVAKWVANFITDAIKDKFAVQDSHGKKIAALEERMSDAFRQTRFLRSQALAVEKKIGGVLPLTLDEENAFLRNEVTKEYLIKGTGPTGDTPGPSGRKRK